MKERRSLVEESFAKFDPPRPPELRASPFQAMVRIMFGCDKFCTYCIVPKVRGPEQSRPAAEIVAEVRRLAAEGCLEITLLGQTVNSYKDASEGRTLRLSDLLARLNEIDGLRRIKFVTNYPRHMTDDLLQAVRDLPKVSPYLHVPVQSGSNEQLKRMKRGYTVEYYREMIERIRVDRSRRGDHQRFHRRLLRRDGRRFPAVGRARALGPLQEQLYFQVQRCPGTKAAGAMPDDVPDEVKRRRNNELLAVQNAISLEDNLPLAGEDVEVLVEGPSKAAQNAAGTMYPVDDEIVQLVGRSVTGPYRGLRRPAGACRADPAGADRKGGCVYAARTGGGWTWSSFIKGEGEIHVGNTRGRTWKDNRVAGRAGAARWRVGRGNRPPHATAGGRNSPLRGSVGGRRRGVGSVDGRSLPKSRR